MSDQQKTFIKYGYYWVRTRDDGDVILWYGPDNNDFIIGWWYGNEYYDRENILMRLSPKPITNPYI
jgi:hypothetical protein